MKLDGHKRLDVFVPDDLWDRMEKARGEWSRSGFVRHQIEQGCIRSEENAAPEVPGEGRGYAQYGLGGGTVPAPGSRAETREPKGLLPARAKAEKLKTAREILQERTRLMREGKNVQ